MLALLNGRVDNFFIQLFLTHKDESLSTVPFFAVPLVYFPRKSEKTASELPWLRKEIKDCLCEMRLRQTHKKTAFIARIQSQKSTQLSSYQQRKTPLNKETFKIRFISFYLILTPIFIMSVIVQRNCSDFCKMRPPEIILKSLHSLRDSTYKMEKD